LFVSTYPQFDVYRGTRNGRCGIGWPVKTCSARIITAASMGAHNTFENPDQVGIADFPGAEIVRGAVRLKLPPMSVAMVELG
jgi:alpha-N-arabinofuranosidase